MDPQQIATLRDAALIYFACLGVLVLIPFALLALWLNLFARRQGERWRVTLRDWRGELLTIQQRTRGVARGLTYPLVTPVSLASGLYRALRVLLDRR